MEQEAGSERAEASIVTAADRLDGGGKHPEPDEDSGSQKHYNDYFPATCSGIKHNIK